MSGDSNRGVRENSLQKRYFPARCGPVDSISVRMEIIHVRSTRLAIIAIYGCVGTPTKTVAEVHVEPAERFLWYCLKARRPWENMRVFSWCVQKQRVAPAPRSNN